jgi:hypothetical protein
LALKRSYKKPTGELALFRKIVIERGSFSEISDTPIYDITVSSMMHVIRKSKTEACRLDPRNIIIGTPDEHYQWDNNRWEIADNPKWDWVRKREEELLKQYS